MVARLVVLCGCALMVTSPCGWASEGNDVASSAQLAEAMDGFGEIAVSAGNAPSFEPRISPEITGENRGRLMAAFQLALERVNEVPECRELFDELGAVAIDTLGHFFFFPIGKLEARANVCRTSVAYTYVGGGPTWLCRKYWRLTEKDAAKIIIHEALHHAGLTERPKDPGGMTSAGINRMVSKRCGL
jgi:hypothetical protein